MTYIPILLKLKKKPIAYIKYHRVNNEDRAHFKGVKIPDNSIGIDLFIGDQQYLGRGYGTTLLKEFIAHIKTQEPQCAAIIIDPAPDNIRAIACYQKVGFEKKGIFKVPYGPTGEGPGDILLMIYPIKK